MRAIGFAGGAAAASVPDEQVAPMGPGVSGDNFHKVTFDFDRVAVLGESEALAEASNVRIDNDPGFDAEGVAENNVGGFASDARQVREGFQVAGNLAVMVLGDGGGRGADVFGFVAKEAGRADEFLDVFLRGGGHARCVGKLLEKRGGDHVDAFVGALRGEDGGNEKLESASVIERTMGVRVGAAQNLQDMFRRLV